MTNRLQIAPSVLAADPLHIGREVKMMLEFGADLLHVDIMDGHFVPNVTYGRGMVKALKKGFPNIVHDVHLMMSYPEDHIDDFIEAGADELTIHVEVAGDVEGMLRYIRERGLKAGLSLRPKTSAEELLPYLPFCDLIMIMSVEPGLGGQKIIPETLDKLVYLREHGYKGLLSVDGGINQETMGLVIRKGGERLIMGTGLFGSPNPALVIEEARKIS